MFLLMAVGFASHRLHFVKEDGAAQFSSFLLMIVSPAVIIDAFQTPFDPQLAKGLLLSFALATVSHLIGLAAATLLIRRDETNRYRIQRFAAVYSNCGFMAIPLIGAILGERGVFYSSTYIAVFNLFMWTHGDILMSGKTSLRSVAKAFANPSVISVGVGLVLFLTSFHLPGILNETVGYVAALNTPLAMVITGVNMSMSDLKSAFRDLSLVKVALIRLLLIPAMMMGVLLLVRADETILLANLLATSCPVAATTVLFSNRHGRDAGYASKLVALTTLLSILTISGITAVYGLLQG